MPPCTWIISAKFMFDDMNTYVLTRTSSKQVKSVCEGIVDARLWSAVENSVPLEGEL